MDDGLPRRLPRRAETFPVRFVEEPAPRRRPPPPPNDPRTGREFLETRLALDETERRERQEDELQMRRMREKARMREELYIMRRRLAAEQDHREEGPRRSRRHRNPPSDHNSDSDNVSDSRRAWRTPDEWQSSDDELQDYQTRNLIERITKRDQGSSDGGETEDELERDAFNFRLPRFRDIQIMESITTMSDTSTKAESFANFETNSDPMKLGTLHYVYSSQYTGEGSHGGNHSAKITISTSPRRGEPHLFRWAHFEDPNMDFERFQTCVTHVPGLTNTEMSGLLKLMGKVRRNYDKGFQAYEGLNIRSMLPSIIQENLSPEDRPKARSARQRIVTWMCVPYFSLEKYSKPNATTTGAHPLRTLLQARYMSTPKERDLQQAVCQIPGTPREFCYHIAQLWCIILDDSLLITLSRVPKSAIDGDAVTITSAPTPVMNGHLGWSGAKLLISFGESVLWSLPVDRCLSWFEFIGYFREFWPKKYRITYNGRVLTAELWPRVISAAKRLDSNIRLSFQLGSGPKSEMVRGVLKRPSEIAPTTVEGINEVILNKTSPLKGFQVFSLLNTTSNGSRHGGVVVDRERLQNDLRLMDQYLTGHVNWQDRSAYIKCPEASRSAVYDLMEEEEKKLIAARAETGEERERGDLKKRQQVSFRIDLLNALDFLFQFFFPADFDGPTLSKFWGAILKLLVKSSPYKSPETSSLSQSSSSRRDKYQDGRDIIELLEWPESLCRRLKLFLELFAEAKPEELLRINIPEQLVKAWLHILIALAYNSGDTDLWEKNMNVASMLMDNGMKAIVIELGETSLLDSSVVMPSEIATLIQFHLLQDLTKVPGRPDIVDTYTQYLGQVASQVQSNPLDRTHQEKLDFLRQEIATIRATIQEQSLIFTNFLEWSRKRGICKPDPYAPIQYKLYTGASYGYEHEYDRAQQPSFNNYRRRAVISGGDWVAGDSDEVILASTAAGPASQLTVADSGGYRDLIGQDILDFLERRMLNFDQMDEKAIDLERWNISKIDTNRDRQESAIYAFTIVTVIFLPLSTVATILGMNTSDVRDMQYGQWLFWVVALPVTFIILILSLFWTGEFNRIRRGAVWRVFQSSLGRTDSWKSAGSAANASANANTPPPANTTTAVPIAIPISNSSPVTTYSTTATAAAAAGTGTNTYVEPGTPGSVLRVVPPPYIRRRAAGGSPIGPPISESNAYPSTQSPPLQPVVVMRRSGRTDIWE